MNATTRLPPPARHAGVRLLLASLVFAAASGVALTAWAQGGPGGHHGPGMMMGGAEHMGRMADHLLDGLQASDAQRAQVRQIAQAAAAELKPQTDAGRALRQQALQVFTAPVVDAAAAEALRQQMQAQHEQVSRRVLRAMVDIAAVLSPEQRVKLGERMKQRGEMMHERMQRMGHGPEHKQ